MTTFNIDDKVLTPHGKGRIKAFAAWDISGDEVYITEHIGDNRVIIHLDKDHTWCFQHLDYCAFPKDIEVIDNVCNTQDVRNANLIASAPDMYNALEILHNLGGLGQDKHKMIQDVLTKARGN